MKIKSFFKQLDFSWRSISDYLLIIAGGLVQALALRTFLIPAQLVGGGVSGVAQLLYYLWGTPVGMVTLWGISRFSSLAGVSWEVPALRFARSSLWCLLRFSPTF